MGATSTLIEATLNATELKNCCVVNAFKGLGRDGRQKDTRLVTWGHFQHKNNKVLAVGPDVLKNAAAYLTKGEELAKSAPWAGVCQTFACASAFVIHKNVTDIPSIELFSFGSAFNGHVYLVLRRREGSTEGDPDTWGKALIVDIWYAIQKETPDTPVYKGGEYLTWLKKQATIKCVLRVK